MGQALDKIRRLARDLEALGTPGSPEQRALLKPVADRLKKRIRQQVNTGTDPTGAPQALVKSGKRPGLKGNRIVNPIKVEPTDAGKLRIFVDTAGGAPQWMADALEAHQHGHEWPVRSQRVAINAKGRIISWAKFRRAVAASKRLEKSELEAREVEEVFGKTTKRGIDRVRARIRRMKIGKRVLPIRELYPENDLPGPWAADVKDGLTEGLAAFVKKVTR